VRRAVEVRGEVEFPGVYVIDEGEETLGKLISRAGGLTSEAAVQEATLTRSIGTETVDPEFERLKLIEVADMTRDEYEYFKLRSREHKGRVVVDFERLLIGGVASEDVLLRRGDIVAVPTATRSIKVAGQVAAPGAIAFEEGKPVKWYIERAGGYAWRASKGKTRVIRARSGEWVKAKDARDLGPGDTIWVPEKPERDYWEMFKEGLAITSQILTAYLVIDRISE
jgi:protein involved in polysaccharide export with SLBB domain